MGLPSLGQLLSLEPELYCGPSLHYGPDASSILVPKTAFSTPLGLLEYTVLCLGLNQCTYCIPAIA